MSHWHSWGLRFSRWLALSAAAALLHVAAQRHPIPTRPASITLEQAARFFPEAVEVRPPSHAQGADEIYDDQRRLLGFVAATSPQADDVIGYAGPNNILTALDAKGRVIATELIASGDTVAHVAEVKKAATFWQQFIGWTPSQEPMPTIEGVSGSTLTSLGIAEAVQKRWSGSAPSLRFPEPVTLEEVRALFPTARRFAEEARRPGWHRVWDGNEQWLGSVVRTSPASDYTRGHSGPTESLLAVSADGEKLLGVRLRRSYDTPEYTDRVGEDAEYLGQLTNFSVRQWAAMDFKKSGLEGVSGATETSFALAEGLRRRLAADTLPAKTTSHFWPARDWALLGIIVGSVVMTFSPWRGHRIVRLIWQAILIGVFGLWCGNLLSLALLAGWARHGVAWQLAPSLAVLAAVALLVPWATRRQIYCHHLCPHGAAQEWLGRFKPWHIPISPKTVERLKNLPGIFLVGAFALALLWPRFELANLEPFDAWALRGTVLASTLLALAGLAGSLFVPMAYCRFGCPTGELLKFLRHTGSNDHFGKRDWAGWILLCAAAVFIFWPTGKIDGGKTETAGVMQGAAFGTTWKVKLRGAAPPPALSQRLAAELERIESSLSHWRASSFTSTFNAAHTTQPIEVSEELAALVAQALELSRASDGAFDITVAPLVKAWGFGPGGAPPSAPTAEEVARLRAFTGWEKLNVDRAARTLRKTHPELQIDLGAILQGYAVDRLAELLDAADRREYLIEVGGELRARGSWHVAVENPAEPQRPLQSLQLQNASLATSGTYRARRSDGEKRWSHLIDPRTGEPVQHQTSLVSVVCASCAQADAWGTTLLVAGAARAERLAREHQLGVLLVSGGGVTTVNFPK